MSQRTESILNDKGLRSSVFKAKFSLIIGMLFTISNASKVVGVFGIYGYINALNDRHHLDMDDLPAGVKFFEAISYQIITTLNCSSTFYVYKWLEKRSTNLRHTIANVNATVVDTYV